MFRNRDPASALTCGNPIKEEDMEFGLVGILALGTLVAVAVLATISKRRTDKRNDDSDAPKSTLAKDAPDR